MNIASLPLNIDDIVSDLRDQGSLTAPQISKLLEMEYLATVSERSEDAKIVIAKLPPSSSERIFVENNLQETYKFLNAIVRGANCSQNPTLVVVTGAPGSGKSTLSKRLTSALKNSIYLCGDMVKEEFQSRMRQLICSRNVDESVYAKYLDAVYIHRLTSPITWKLLHDALELKKNVVLEMIGTDAVSDSKTMVEAFCNGYKVELHHVACNQRKAIESAVLRYFSSGLNDSGRYISIVNIANKQMSILGTFASTLQSLSEINCHAIMYDNSNWLFERIFEADTSDKLLPNISQFEISRDDQGLWYLGENPSADLVVLAYDRECDLSVLMCKRGQYPFAGSRSLPGGFIYTTAIKGDKFVADMETAANAAIREFAEKTLFKIEDASKLTFLGVYSAIDRDPRNTADRLVTSHAFCMFADHIFELIHFQDGPKWEKAFSMLSDLRVAFDHRKIISDAISILQLPLRKR